MIQYIASYNCSLDFALIFCPVADSGSLADMLQGVRYIGAPTLWERRILEKSFAYIAAGLDFIHKKSIHHKDIKPENILVY
jgi:serine/threonine protein kinase